LGANLLTFLFLITSAVLSAQTSPAPPQLSPEAAYNQAVTPIEITHRSIANWSDTEIGALGVAVIQAKQACLERAPITYTGDDLISYARLCAFGQQWPATLTAATSYIKSTDPTKPQLAKAYAYLIQANLNLADEPAALASSLDMLQAVPYDPVTDEVITASTDYLKVAFPFDALTLQNVRQPILLRLLRSSQSKPSDASSQSPTFPPIPPHTLFEHVLTGAAIQQYINQPKAAAAMVADLDAAVPSALPPDESILIARARRQYALLGTRLPPITISAALYHPNTAARINPDFGSSTVLLLFPPWCAQCIRMAHTIAPTLVRLNENNIHIYGLLADDPPPPAPVPTPKPIPSHSHRPTQSQQEAPASPDKPEPPLSAADQLRGTFSFVVAPSTLTDFAADDFPFLIATDHDGIIRLLLPAAPDSAFVVGGAIDQITTQIAKEWPAPSTR
jgi:hypothetical protein